MDLLNLLALNSLILSTLHYSLSYICALRAIHSGFEPHYGTRNVTNNRTNPPSSTKHCTELALFWASIVVRTYRL
jgi:hypothetical protein